MGSPQNPFLLRHLELTGQLPVNDLIMGKFPFADVRRFGSLNAAVANIGPSELKTVIISTQTYLVDDLTVSANIRLQVVEGGRIYLGDYDLTLAKAPIAGDYRIFYYTGTGVVTIAGVALPQWWGPLTDETILQKAVNAANAILLTPDTFIGDNVIIKKPLDIFGSGRNSIVTATPAATGYIFQVDGTQTGAVKNFESHLYGVTLRNFALKGNMRGASIGGIYTRKLDHSLIENLWIEEFQREALCLFSDTRESTFRKIHTRWCANRDTGGTSYPNINLKDQDNAALDANNLCTFEQIYSVYPMGDHVWIDTVAGHGFQSRAHTFERCKFHGLVAAKDGAGKNPGDWTFTADQKGFRMFQIGNADDIQILNNYINSLGIETKGIDIDTGAGGDPGMILFKNNIIKGRYSYAAGGAAANDICFYANKGNIVFGGNIIIGSGVALSSTLTIEGAAILYNEGGTYLSGVGPSVEKARSQPFGTFVPASQVNTMTGGETMTPWGACVFFKDCGGADRNFNPGGTFPAGTIVFIFNTGVANNITFDNGGLGAVIAPNKLGIFSYNGSAWEGSQVN